MSFTTILTFYGAFDMLKFCLKAILMSCHCKILQFGADFSINFECFESEAYLI